MYLWVWDGDDLLAQCFYDSNNASQCSAWNFSVEGLADYSLPSTINVNDRGISGQVVDMHGGTGFTGMTMLGRPNRVYWNGGVNASAAPPSTDGMSMNGGVAHKISGDGWTFENNTWQGVRTYDSSAGTWTTPDAYAGNIHDPMSQKPFMWDRNDPMSYADPSGFIIEFHGDNAAQLYDQAIDYFGSHHADEAADLLRRIRDDPNHTFVISVTSAGARGQADIAGIRDNRPAVDWDSRSGLSTERGVQSPAMGLLHEAAHAWRIATDRHGYEMARHFPDNEYGDREEKRVIDGIERRTAQILGEPTRDSHEGISCAVTTSVTGRRC